MNNALQQRIAIAGASILLVAAIIVLAVRAGDDEDTAALPSPPPTAERTARPDATATAAPKTTTPSGRTDAPRTAAPTTAPDDTVKPGRTVPPKPGKYEYRLTQNDERSTSTLEISSLGATRRREVSEQGFTNESTWSDEGKFLTKTTFGEPPSSFDCAWEPPIRELKLPLVRGSSWAIRGTCTAGPGVTISFDGETEVTGATRAVVGGVRVDVWQMSTEVTLTTKTPQGSFEQTVSSEDQFAPEHGLYVRSAEESRGTDPRTGRETTQRSTQELVSLTPD